MRGKKERLGQDFDKNLERKSGKLEENLGGKSGEEDVKKRLKGINF